MISPTTADEWLALFDHQGQLAMRQQLHLIERLREVERALSERESSDAPG